jgi:glyoxylase-like metal-dependent hydrolase (beta-lactamase superfamily II)
VTLPPATHTNTLLVGEERLLVVDPGSCYPEEQAALERQLELLAGLGRRADAILLTHHHPDHVDGAMPLATRFGLGILAHEQTAARISDRVRIDGLVADGDRLPYGRHGLEVLHLPGHTQGHLCLLEPGSRAVVAGDLVAGTGTVIIDPPEGSMADYCASLRRLLAREPGTVYPAHGPVAPAGVQLLAGTLAHRLQREEKVRAALAARAGPALPRELVAAVYGDVDPSLHGFAERSLLAHLEKLATDGRARVVGDRFEAA